MRDDLVDAAAFREAQNKALSERAFQRGIMRLGNDPALPVEWRIYHTRAVVTRQREVIGPITPVTSKGFPDLVLACAAWGRVIVAELKTERGTPTADQRWWLDVLAASGIETYLWRPRHYEYIQAVLFEAATAQGRTAQETGAWGASQSLP